MYSVHIMQIPGNLYLLYSIYKTLHKISHMQCNMLDDILVPHFFHSFYVPRAKII